MENGEDISEKKALKKRRKRYQDLFEYLNFDKSNGFNSDNQYHGLLMRDKKYLRKNM